MHDVYFRYGENVRPVNRGESRAEHGKCPGDRLQNWQRVTQLNEKYCRILAAVSLALTVVFTKPSIEKQDIC